MSKYHRVFKGVTLDVYEVLALWNVTNPATQHAIKKLLMPGQRGSKDLIQDLNEARQSIDRAIQLEQDSLQQSIQQSIELMPLTKVAEPEPEVPTRWFLNPFHQSKEGYQVFHDDKTALDHALVDSRFVYAILRSNTVIGGLANNLNWSVDGSPADIVSFTVPSHTAASWHVNPNINPSSESETYHQACMKKNEHVIVRTRDGRMSLGFMSDYDWTLSEQPSDIIAFIPKDSV